MDRYLVQRSKKNTFNLRFEFITQIIFQQVANCFYKFLALIFRLNYVQKNLNLI